MKALTVRQLHDQWFREHYDIVPKKAVSVPTRDARTSEPSLWGRERGRTRDELLVGPEPVTRISLGKIWTGGDDDPLVTAANEATQEFAEGTFAAGRVLHAENLDDYISSLRTHANEMAALREKMADAELRAGTGHGPAADKPPGEGSRLDGRTADRALANRGSPLFAAAMKHTQDFAVGLASKRAALTAQPQATSTVGARATAAEFAALRVRKGAAA